MIKKKTTKRLLLILAIILLILGAILLSLFFAIRSHKVQNFITDKATQSLSEKINGDVDIGNIEIDFFNKIKIDDILVLDYRPDTLLYIKQINANFSYFSLLQKEISLDNISINTVEVDLYKSFSDSLFNFEKLIDTKAIEHTDTTKTSKQSAWQFSLEKTSIENIKFQLSDEPTGTSVSVKSPLLQTNFKEFDISNQTIALETLLINSPHTIVSLDKKNENRVEGKDFILNIPLKIESDIVLIDSARFQLYNKLDTNNYHNFAFNNIDVTPIDISMSDIYIFQDSIYTNIDSLFALEKSGFQLSQLSSQVAITNNTIKLTNFNLSTPNSKIGDFASLDFSLFKDFKTFITDVTLNTSFKRSEISPKDIAYFVDLNKIGLIHPIFISGKLKGTVNNLNGDNIQLKTGENTIFNGSFDFRGLPIIKETFISFKINQATTDFNDLSSVLSHIPLPEKLKNFGRISFKGRFDGFITDFVAYGKMQTDIGIINMDANLKINQNDIPSFSGNINTQKFNVGKFLDAEKWITHINMSAKIEGEGLSLSTLEAKVEGKIDSIYFKDYNYKNISLDGLFSNRLFNGEATIDDPNVKLDFNGLVDLTKSKPHFNFYANLYNANLNELNLINQKYKLSTELNADFSASNIDDIIGSLDVKNLTIKTEEKDFTMKEINIRSHNLSNGEKRISLSSDNISALIEGSFQLSKIPQAIQEVFIPSDTSTLTPQKVRFDISITDKSELMTLFVPQIRIPNKTIDISGNLDSRSESILASIYIPTLYYNNFKAKRFVSNIQVKNGEFDIICSLPKVLLNDSIVVKDFSFLAKGPRENLTLNLNASNKNTTSALNIIAHLIKIPGGRKLQFEPSTILANRSYWSFDEDNTIYFIDSTIISSDLKLFSKISDIKIDLGIGTIDDNINVDLSNLKIEDFTDFLQEKDIRLEGLVNGNIEIKNPLKNPALSGTIETNNITVNGYSIGKLTTEAILDLPNEKVDIQGKLSGNENDIDITGNYSFSKKSTPKDFDIRFNIKKFAIKSIEDFIPQYIDKTEGVVNGHLYLTGKRTAPNLLGFVNIPDVTTTVSYTQTRYNILNQKVNFEKNFINLGDSLIVFDMDSNIAYGSGGIRHNNLKDIKLDIHVSSPLIKGLNTTAIDNNIFYGTAYLKGGVSFTGLTNDLLIHIHGESEQNTEISVPISDKQETKSHKFYTFITPDIKIQEELSVAEKDNKIKLKGVTVKLDLDIDEDCKVNLILDQSSGDVLKAKGEGNIKIDVARGGESVDFTGTYLISEGDYLFTLQNLVNKRFKIDPNSTIYFNGPIEDAIINVDAVYGLRSSTYTLIEDYLLNTTDEVAELQANNRVPVKLYLKLSDKLNAPTINFQIEVEEVDNSIKSYVDNKIQTIQQYENELNRQVFGLLVLNQFLPTANSTQANQTTAYLSGGAANTVSEFLSNQLSRYFNDWLSYVVDDLDFNINYRTYDQETTTNIDELSLQKRREFQLALSKRFLNDRLSINVGGNVDFGEDYYEEGANSTYFGGDFSIEYAITKDKRLRAKAFTNTDYNHFDGENQVKAGAGLSYKREFDKIGEFFGIKKKKKELENTSFPTKPAQ